MNAIFSMHRKYTELIFNGIKNLEFRKKVGMDFNTNDTIFIYETKKDGGSGMIVGEVRINKITEIKKYPKLGAYTMLPYFVKKFGTEEEQRQVKKAMEIHLTNFDESIVLNYIFDNWTLNYMIKNNDVPDWFNVKHPLWPNVKEYNSIHQKSAELLDRCDEWSNIIGFYDKYGTSYWKHIIELENPQKYKIPIPITEFKNKTGNNIKRAPQSWCYTLTEV